MEAWNNCLSTEYRYSNLHLNVLSIFDYIFIQVIEQNIAENTKIKEISEVFAKFLETAPPLENFYPGLFVTDRSQNDMEPHTFSLCFKYVSTVKYFQYN